MVVERELWGAITTFSRERPLPAGMEPRRADFTELWRRRSPTRMRARR
jgi:hypothetical protein